MITGILTVKYGNKVWTIHGGNHDIFRSLNANYILYYQILIDAKEQGYEVMDFLEQLEIQTQIIKYTEFTYSRKDLVVNIPNLLVNLI